MARVEAAVKALLVARLREQRAAGTLSTAVVRAAANDIGVAERTVWGWVAAGPQALDRAQRLSYVERTVNRDGVHFGGIRFLAPELNGLVGERLQVRYTPHDLRRIELFRGDEWLATAYPQDTLDDEQRAAVLARRRADAAELGRRHRRASRRARAQLTPITAPGPTEDTTVITAGAARAKHNEHGDPASTRGAGATRSEGSGQDAALRRQARTNLLDLKTDFAFWNPGLATPDPAAAGPRVVELDELGPRLTEHDTEQNAEHGAEQGTQPGAGERG